MTDNFQVARDSLVQARAALEEGLSALPVPQQSRINNLLRTIDRELILVRELAGNEKPRRFTGG